MARGRTVAAAALLLTMLRPGAAAQQRPADPAAWCPGTWTFYLAVRDLKGLADAAEKAHLLRRFGATRLGRRLGIERKTVLWRRFRQGALRATGTDLSVGLRDAFGGGLGLVSDLRVGVPDPPWLLLLLAVKPGANAEVLRMAWDADREKGRILDLDERAENGIAVVRVQRANGKVEHHALSDRLFLTSEQEKSVQAAVAAGLGKAPSLAANRRFAAARKALGDGRVFAWVDLRALCASVPDPGPDASPAAALARSLRRGALEAFTLRGATAPGRFGLRARLMLAPDRLPKEVSVLLAPPGEEGGVAPALPTDRTAAQLWLRMPLDKVFDLAGWLAGPDGTRAYRRIVAAVRSVFGGRELAEIARHVGPGIGLVIFPQEGEGTQVLRAALLIEVTPDPMMRGRILGGLDTLFTAVSLSRSDKDAPARERFQLTHWKDGETWTAEMIIRAKRVPPGFRPNYGFAGDFLAFTTNRAAMKAVRGLAAPVAARPDAPEGGLRVLHVDVPRAMAVIGAMLGLLAGEDAPAEARWRRARERFEAVREALAPLQTIVVRAAASRREVVVGLSLRVDWTRWPLPAEDVAAPPP